MRTVADIGSFEGTKQELAQLVFDQVTTYPETHDQNDWIQRESDCGTVACIGGWASLFCFGYIASFTISMETNARESLGLNEYDGLRLFYHVTNEQAVLALKFLANGEPIDWAAVGHRYPSQAAFELAWRGHINLWRAYGRTIS